MFRLADALRGVIRHVAQLDANGVLAARQADGALAQYRPEDPDLTVELQGAAALMLCRLNEVPRQYLHPTVVEAARNLREKLTRLGVQR